MDISILTPLATTAVALLAAAAYSAGLSYLKRKNLDTTVFEAVGRAGGVAYTALVQSGKPATDPAALRSAAVAGADYLAARIPEALATKGVGVSAAVDIVHAELGKLLAADPAVSPGGEGNVTDGNAI